MRENGLQLGQRRDWWRKAHQEIKSSAQLLQKWRGKRHWFPTVSLDSVKIRIQDSTVRKRLLDKNGSKVQGEKDSAEQKSNKYSKHLDYFMLCAPMRPRKNLK